MNLCFIALYHSLYLGFSHIFILLFHFDLDFSTAVISAQLALWRSLAFLLIVDICYFLNFSQVKPEALTLLYLVFSICLEPWLNRM